MTPDEPSLARPMVVVVAGPAGVGKTTVGTALARALGWDFLDADDFHTAASRARMQAGIALTDEERAPWLAALAAAVARHVAERRPVVLACSALRRAYRRALVPPGVPAGTVRFVLLDASPALLAARLARREGHFFAPALLATQLAALEEPGEEEGALVEVEAGRPVDEVVETILRFLTGLA